MGIQQGELLFRLQTLCSVEARFEKGCAMIKITLEFESVDAAIVGLGKLVGAPVAPKQPRKGRDDKGQPRGTYKPRATEAGAPDTPGATQAQGALASSVPTQAAPAVAPASSGGATAETPPAAAVPGAVSSAQAVVVAAKTESAESLPTTTTEPATFAQAEAAFQTFFNAKGVQPARELFAKFGIARITELKPEQYAEFVNAAR